MLGLSFSCLEFKDTQAPPQIATVVFADAGNGAIVTVVVESDRRYPDCSLSANLCHKKAQLVLWDVSCLPVHAHFIWAATYLAGAVKLEKHLKALTSLHSCPPSCAKITFLFCEKINKKQPLLVCICWFIFTYAKIKYSVNFFYKLYFIQLHKNSLV